MDSSADASSPSGGPDSLVGACYTALTTGPLDHARLEQLPQHMLVQLLTQAVTDRDQADTVKKQQAEELAKLEQEKRNRYVIDPPCVMDRVGDDMYDRVQAVTAKWAPRRNLSDFTAHVSMLRHLMYNSQSKTFFLNERISQRLLQAGPNMMVCDLMSSALLLYRVCCLFRGLHVEVEGSDGYKVVWSAEVQHVATGEAVGFSEWKGAALVRMSNQGGPKAYKDDMFELLNLIFDEKCPHPYDGTVAGTMAQWHDWQR